MTHLGDITKIDWVHVPPVDVVTGGSPCQDLSVAGKRAGLAGERSGLYMEQIRCVKELRQADEQRGRTGIAIRPRYMVWENVPGAFSSNGGKDFAAVLEEAVKVVCPESPPVPVPEGGWPTSGCLTDGVAGRWSIAWRVHDAQFWGVPQRRRRISLVADFAGWSAPEILFEREGLSGNIEESGKEREGAAADLGTDTETAGWAFSFQERAGKPGGGKGILIQDEHTGALSTFNNQRVCCLNNQAVVYGISAYESNAMKSNNPHSGIYEAETARTLDLNGGSPACNQGGMAVVQAIEEDSIVRRLTPLEAERLQGYPDGWTDIGEWVDSKGKRHKDADSPRYKALGNSIALPFWFWLLRRISAQYIGPATLGSLFDGIGGFPLCWERCNGKGTALWASEIEEFPMAVTLRHFGEEATI